jgi:cytochrome c2
MRGVRRGLILVAVSLACAAGAASAQPLFGPGQDPLAGSRVFGSKGCVKCHAVNGVGGTVGPDLGRLPGPRSFNDLAAAMWNHLPRMADRMRQLGIPRPELDARETADLVAFLATLNYFDRPGNPEAGRALFAAKRCVICHQVGGVGGVVGPNLDHLALYGSPLAVAAAMWNHGPQMTEAMRARNIERPVFKETELLDLIAYLKRAAPTPSTAPVYLLPGDADQGRRLFAEKRCLECHAVGGQGGRIGPDLAGRGLAGSLTQFAAAMWNKAPAMLAAMKARAISAPQLRAEEMADIVAYLYSIHYFSAPGDVRKGAILVTNRGCLNCHALYGERGKPASDLSRAKGLESPAGVVAVMWNHSFFVTEQRTDHRPVQRPQFTADEMGDLVAYLRSLRSKR